MTKQCELNANKVFIADTLEKIYFSFHKELTSIFEKHNINYGTLKGTKGIWTRDFAPVQTNKGFVQFKYVGHSLTEKEKEAGVTQFLDVDYAEHNIFQFNEIIYEKIIADGGNFVKGDGVTFICDSIFKRNPDITTETLYQWLEHYFGKIVIIPQMPNEVIGHADGYIRPINANTVLRNRWDGIENGEKYNVDEDRTFLLTLLNAGLVVKDLPNAYDMDNMYSDFGDYGNYLVVGNLFVLQRYGIIEDFLAMDLFKSYFGDKYIYESVDCNEICLDGGALNCCTVTYNL